MKALAKLTRLHFSKLKMVIFERNDEYTKSVALALRFVPREKSRALSNIQKQHSIV